ncbi:STAS domain-containing protein [Gallionella capsiferriformans]|uniref:Anti-sigma factor antagonist n=1 Tax=Gallionella capsiferriformans (strain ES-2) TaxID=395494 RepID=D9SEW0_GALCS|nr:STAS domain-containing protein [Gallionella capsiferriformans]ADL55057.1 anti-anti-sigma factor [Gallionella capsiferriformans ES-2]
MAMQINTSTAGDKAIIRLAGRFDFNDHRTFKMNYEPLLLLATVKTLEIDMEGIEYLDSSALGMMMLLRERSQAVGKTVVLSKPSSTVAQVLDIANFSKLFTITK